MVDQLRPMGPAKPRRSIALVIALLVLMVGVAALSSFVALRQLDTAISSENRTRLDGAKRVFDLLRTRHVEEMRGQGRIIVEFSGLKTSLNQEGMDEATIADMLCDVLRALNGVTSKSAPPGCDKVQLRGMLVVLTPEGRVFAQANAPELRGLSLGESRVVKEAQKSSDAVVGSWVIGNKIIDLSIVPFRFDVEGGVIAYLVVGQTVDQSLLKSLGTATGVDAGIAIGADWTAVSDDKLKAMPALAQKPAGDHVVELEATRYVANVLELEQMGQSRPRLVLIQSLAPTGATFSIFRWLLWLSPLLVLIGMVLAISRSTYRAS